MQFSLIIPSYNNSGELIKELPGLIAFLKEKGIAPEVLIVNDGSPDIAALKEFCLSGNYKLISHEVNLGKGAAVRTGIQHAQHEIRIFTDADIPFQYDIFPTMLQAFSQKDVMMVAGDRRKSDYFSKTPLVRRMGSMVFSWLVNLIMGRNLGDTQCGIKGFRAAVVDQVFGNAKLNGFAADIEWIYRTSKSNSRIAWVNAEFRNAGESSVVFWKQAIKMLRDVIRLRMSGL